MIPEDSKKVSKRFEPVEQQVLIQHRLITDIILRRHFRKSQVSALQFTAPFAFDGKHSVTKH